jgi:transposase InsO family protein
MPWKETRVVEERLRFIAAVLEDPKGEHTSHTELCARFGISRAKGYKWIKRYEELGPQGLADQQPIARTCPHKTDAEVVDRILAMRKKWPREGPKKLRAMLLELDPPIAVPAASTIGDILERNGMIRPRRARLRVPPSASPLSHAVEPNDLWCVDFKGHFALSDGMRCHPLTISDAASRYLLKCEGLVAPTEALSRPHFELAFREYGLPRGIRSDNGAPFASKALGGLSRLSIWWIQLGILPERIEPGQPQQNGRHERMHLTLKEHTASPPYASLVVQQRAFELFRADYNNRRPHEALGQTPPARHYEPSRVALPDKPRPLEYASDIEARKVAPNGYVTWKGTAMHVGSVLAGQRLGFKPIDEDEWELFYGPVLLGDVIARGGKARIEPVSTATKAEGRSR